VGLRIRLLGKFRLQADATGEPIAGFESSKVQELFAFLLLHRSRPHTREVLANLLWRESGPDQGRKYLRQTLWQLQSALDPYTVPDAPRLLTVGSEGVSLNPDAELWLDVAEFERLGATIQGIRGIDLDKEGATAARAAVELYKADLLDGWYQDWCLCERERIQNQCLGLLDKLMRFCEVHCLYEEGISFGNRLLGFDRAREHAHRGIMRMLYLSGDRTAALRQYERCVSALDEELGVRPDRRTRALDEQIRSDQLELTSSPPEAEIAGLSDIAGRLRQLQLLLTDLQSGLQHDVLLVERAIQGRPSRSPDAITWPRIALRAPRA
jgi:DNA-binding SARP family transcriptional activator